MKDNNGIEVDVLPYPKARIFIMAENFNQAAYYANQNNINGRDWTFLYETQQLMGVSAIDLHRVGTYWNYKHYKSIMNYLYSRPDMVHRSYVQEEGTMVPNVSG